MNVMFLILNGLIIINSIILGFKVLSNEDENLSSKIESVFIRVTVFLAVVLFYSSFNLLYMFLYNIKILYYIVFFIFFLWNILLFKNSIRHMNANLITKLYSSDNEYMNGVISVIIILVSVFLLYIYIPLFITRYL